MSWAVVTAVGWGLNILWWAAVAAVVYTEYYTSGTDPWTRWGQDYDPGPFCERERTLNFLREPSNAMSDFVFLCVGFFMIYCACEDSYMISAQSRARRGVLKSSDKLGFLSSNPRISLLAGVINILHAAGSGMNHACRCHVGHQLDVIFMWSATFANLAMILGRIAWSYARHRESWQWLVPALCSLSMISGVAVFSYVGMGVRYPHSYHTIEPGLVYPLAITSLLAVGWLVRMHGQAGPRVAPNLDRGGIETRTFLAAAGCIAVGAVCGKSDSLGHWCDPDAVVQLHAVWHILAGLALALSYAGVRGAPPARSSPAFL